METTMKNNGNSSINCKSNKTNILQVDVPVTGLILTPLTCALLVNEVLKCLLYEKLQIPYPYNWLKTVVNRKANCEDAESDKKPTSFTVQKHFLNASNAYNCIEDFMTNLKREFESKESAVKEVNIVFGTTPLTPKQVFVIQIPKLSRGHVESNHLQTTVKNQHKILRNIFFSPVWLSAMETAVSLTNTFIVIKKSGSDSSNFFLPCGEQFFPTKTKNLVINLMYEETFQACCRHLQIFNDDGVTSSDSKSDQSSESAEEESEYRCYQAKSILKGFKDCFLNKKSVSELW